MNKKTIFGIIVVVITILAFSGIYLVLNPSITPPPLYSHTPTPTGPSPRNTTKSPPPNVTCVIGNATNKYQYVPIKYGAIGTDLWNLEKAKGNTTMKIGENGILNVNSSFSNVTSEYNTILGYPEIAYGHNLQDELFGNSQAASLVFPMKYSTFSELNFTSQTNYSFKNLTPSNIPIDFSYDLWLEHNPKPGVNPTNSDLEVMIWMYCQGSQPIGTNMGSFTQTVNLNNHNINATWEVWAGRANPWETVSFVLKSPLRSISSNISINISKFINEAGNVAKLNLSKYTIMGIEMGNEFGNENIPENISDWTLSYYAFSVSSNKILIVSKT
ncbi:MAG: GH12 family glycosyl hydrolase domain-containing protein [Cuniculiplasma sp.]